MPLDRQPFDEDELRLGQEMAELRARKKRATGKSAPAAQGPGWERLRAQVLREEPTCRMCGAPACEVDHIVPVSDDGTSERSNLRSLCRECHWRKSGAVYTLPRRSDITAWARGFDAMYRGGLTKAGRYRNAGVRTAVLPVEAVEFYGMYVPAGRHRDLEDRRDVVERLLRAGYQQEKKYR